MIMKPHMSLKLEETPIAGDQGKKEAPSVPAAVKPKKERSRRLTSVEILEIEGRSKLSKQNYRKAYLDGAQALKCWQSANEELRKQEGTLELLRMHFKHALDCAKQMHAFLNGVHAPDDTTELSINGTHICRSCGGRGATIATIAHTSACYVGELKRLKALNPEELPND